MKAVHLFACVLIVLHSHTSSANNSPTEPASGTDLSSVDITQAPHILDESTLKQLRSLYTQTEAKLKTASYESIQTLLEPLKNYPLYPYLEYQAYRRFPSKLTQEGVNRFLDQYPGFPKRSLLQQSWLNHLAKERRWNEWITAYQRLPRPVPRYQCDLARAYLATGNEKEGMVLATKLWTVGQSQPDECDQLFEHWMKQGHPTHAEAKTRYWLTAKSGETGLGKYLHRFLDDETKKLAIAYEKLVRYPANIIKADLSKYPEPVQHKLIQRSFQRLARTQLESTAESWIKYRGTINANSAIIPKIDLYIGKRLTFSHSETTLNLLNKIDPEHKYAELTEARLRQLMGPEDEEIDWQVLLKLIETLPEEKRSSDRWSYWYATAVQMLTPDSDAPEKILSSIAKSRSYYGFLAANQLNQPFELNNEPLTIDETLLAALKTNPTMQRAKELFALERNRDAHREWLSARTSFNNTERLYLAAIASEWGWHHRAIMDAIRHEQWNYLDARFPNLFTNLFSVKANNKKIDVMWAKAIARQESAFKPSAVSRAGARGLMQLMPATAKATARKHSISLARLDDLFNPETNIALGTAYLSEMYYKFDRNRAFASAAYNAGPHRVERWLKQRGHLPLDIWIETIPFKETRNYVQNVLAFRVIYGQRADVKVALLAPHEGKRLAHRMDTGLKDSSACSSKC